MLDLNTPNSLKEIEAFVRSKINSSAKKPAGVAKGLTLTTVAALGLGLYIIYSFASKRR